MKKTLIFLLATCLVSPIMAQSYTLTGTAPAGSKWAYLKPLGTDATDSTAVDASGRFSFRGDARGRHLAYVFTKGEQSARFAVFLEGDVLVDLVQGSCSGSDDNAQLSSYQQFTRQAQQELLSVRSELMAKRGRGEEIADEDIARFYALADQVSDTVGKRSRRDLQAYHTSRWPAFIVIDNVNDFDRDYLISLDKDENLFMQEPCLEKVHALIAAYRRTQVGNKFADFEMPDTAGVMHKLSEYAGTGHYTLIDFWATWCGPCMHELPNVKALYDKYHDRGFDIVGISFDQDAESWKAVIRRKQMGWTHLSDLGGWKSLPVEYYGVRAIPFTMLVAPDGTIIATDLAGERLAAKLAEIFE